MPAAALVSARLACSAVTAVEPAALIHGALPRARAPARGSGAVSDGPRLGRRTVRLLLWTGARRWRSSAPVRSYGLPTDRVVLLGWVLAGLAVHAAADGWRRVGRLLADWLPLAALLLAYDATRGLADGLGMPVHVTEPAAADRWLGGGVLPTVWLQQTLGRRLVEGARGAGLRQPLRRDAAGPRRAVGAQPAALGALRPAGASRSRPPGLVTYVLYPAAPPWLAAKEGVIEPVRAAQRRRAGRCSACRAPAPCWPTARARSTRWRPCRRCTRPSPCSPAWCCSRSRAGAWQRVVLVGYAVLMPLVLVWAGEHYVVDTLLGAVYAAAVVLLVPLAGRAGRALGVRRPALPWTA